MAHLRRLKKLGVACALAVTFAATGCGATAGSQTAPTATLANGGRATGSPSSGGGGIGSPAGQNGKGPVLASPVRVPLPTNEISGHTVDEAVQLLREKIAIACGGDQCVSIVAADDEDPSNDGDRPCDTVDSAKDTISDGPDDAGAGFVVVPRSGTIVLLVNVRCTNRPEGPGPSPTPSTPPTEESASSTPEPAPAT